jgi:hypothetical protein
MHPSRPGVLFMQKHWDVTRSDDAGDSWHEISGNLPSDFGFPIDVHANEPETIYVVPIVFPAIAKSFIWLSRKKCLVTLLLPCWPNKRTTSAQEKGTAMRLKLEGVRPPGVPGRFHG